MNAEYDDSPSHNGSGMSATSARLEQLLAQPLLSRRSMMVAMTTAAALTPTALQAQSTDCSVDTPQRPDTEGYFFVFTDRDGKSDDDLADHRIFFISSEWLKAFEVTEYYRSVQKEKGEIWSPQRIVTAIREDIGYEAGPNIKKARVRALYADGPALVKLTANGTDCIEGNIRPDPEGIYLAAMIGPPPTTA